MKHFNLKKFTAGALTAVMLVSALGISAFADSSTTRSYSSDVYSNNAPTEITTDYLSALSGATAAANTTVLEILGINVTSTDAAGVYNSAGTNGQSSPINLLIFGSQWNQKADPYLWNFYCNFNANPTGAGGDYSITAYDGWTGNYTLISSGNKSGPSGQATSGSEIEIEVDGAVLVNSSGTKTTIDPKECNPAFYYEPDVLFSGDTVSSTSALVTLTNSNFAGGWSDYSATSYCSSTYSPFVIGGWNTKQTCLNDGTSASTVAMAEGIVAMATAIESSSDKTGRYGSVLDIANQLYAYNVGVINYASSLNGYYCSNVTVDTDSDGNYLFTIGQSSLSGRMLQYASGVASDLYNTTGAVTLTQAELLTYAANGLAFVGVTIDNSGAVQWLKNNGIGYVPSMPTTVYGTTMQSADNMLGTAYIFGAVYGDLTINSKTMPNELDMLAYWVKNFYHVSDDYITDAMSLMTGEIITSIDSDYTSQVETVTGYSSTSST